MAHLEAQDELGVTPLMVAANYADHTSIRIISEHAAKHRLPLDVNARQINGLTAFDIVGVGAMGAAAEVVGVGNACKGLSAVATVRYLISQRPPVLDPLTLQILVKNTHRTKEELLRMGAVRSVYLSGIAVW